VRNKAPSDFHIYSDGRPEQSTGTYCRHVGLVAARPETAFWEITPVMSPPRHLEASSNLKGPDVKDYRQPPDPISRGCAPAAMLTLALSIAAAVLRSTFRKTGSRLQPTHRFPSTTGVACRKLASAAPTLADASFRRINHPSAGRELPRRSLLSRLRNRPSWASHSHRCSLGPQSSGLY